MLSPVGLAGANNTVGLTSLKVVDSIGLAGITYPPKLLEEILNG